MNNGQRRMLVTGGSGTLGTALLETAESSFAAEVLAPSHSELDLTDECSVNAWFTNEKPTHVIHCAAYIGGIAFKQSNPATIFDANMRMFLNIARASRKCGVQQIINVATALVYPYDADIPIAEADACFIKPEGIDSPYALSKYAAIKAGEYYRNQYGMNVTTVVPCNFFGPHSPYRGDRAGVIPSLVNRMHLAKARGDQSVTVWGTGNAKRDFLSARMVAQAICFLQTKRDIPALINIGSGTEMSIRDAAEMVKAVVGYDGNLVFDATKPEGRLHMQLDNTLLKSLEWTSDFSFLDGVREFYNWYLAQDR